MDMVEMSSTNDSAQSTFRRRWISDEATFSVAAKVNT